MAKRDPLEAVAADLYSLPVAEFTRERNARAADADAELAERIRALKKPTASAWAVNMLARHRSKTVTQLLDLGAALREAQEGLDAAELRALGKQRQQLIAAIVGDTRALAEELGEPIGDAAATEVGQTLQAALADADAAQAVLAGVLTRPLTASGWGGVDVDASVAVPAGGGRTATVTSIDKRRREKAQRELGEAERNLEARRTEADALAEQAAAAAATSGRLAKRLEELRAKLEELEDEADEADRVVAALRRQQDKARTALQDAEAGVADAREQLDRLS